jgi:2-polyprenyl-3-methyl-5-hydroxy-6-metoxy-1,4-benzoquinol methylase
MMNKIIKKIAVGTREVLRVKYRLFCPDPKDYSTTDNLTIIPCQREAYFLALNRYVQPGNEVLDVGFGLGYGLTILAIHAGSVKGIDVDKRCVEYGKGTLLNRNPKLASLDLYDGEKIPFGDESFDLVTCVDVLEHVKDYDTFLLELLRVSRRGVFISTPNRRPENTNKNGTPKNYWHLREWSFDELNTIVSRYGTVEWNFINGTGEGPFHISDSVLPSTQALTPFIKKR